MKKHFFYFVGCAILLSLAVDVFAQPLRGRNQQAPGGRHRAEFFQGRQQESCLGIESLTSEQREQLSALVIQRMDESNRHRLRMDELRNRKRILMLERDADMSGVDQVIDQMEALRSQWMKDNVAHHQEIRNLLTDEQRILFDSRRSGRPMMRNMQGRGFRPNRPR